MGCGASTTDQESSPSASSPLTEKDPNTVPDLDTPGPRCKPAVERKPLPAGCLPTLDETCARPEHFFYMFHLHGVIRPGVREFFEKVAEHKSKGTVKKLWVYSSNTQLPWVRFIMQCVLKFYSLDLSLIDGIKHSVGGLKVVPDNGVLYDDRPEHCIGRCIKVATYTNEIPWEVLEPIMLRIPDHCEDVCPCWDVCGGLQKLMKKDKMQKDCPHDVNSERALLDLVDEFEPYEEVMVDVDGTLLSAARLSVYFNALNHFLLYRDAEAPIDEAPAIGPSDNGESASRPAEPANCG